MPLLVRKGLQGRSFMEHATPSRTALRVALRRAAHQLYDSPVVFPDPVAVPILGQTYAEELRRTPRRTDRPFSIALRAFLVARSRYAEDNLSRAVTAGVRQYVLVGAGLDTFAHRNPYPGLRVFELDHPATQLWKWDLLQRSGIPIPERLTFVPVDFESQSLSAQLQSSGFNIACASLLRLAGCGSLPDAGILPDDARLHRHAARGKRGDSRLRAAARRASLP